jgi:hypothetical protein
MVAFVTPVSHSLWKRQQKTAAFKRDFNRPEVYDFVIQRMENPTNGKSALPKRVTLLRPDPSNPAGDQLLIDHLPIPRDAWHYQVDHQTLIWKGAYGGGRLHFYHQGRGAVGTIGADFVPCSVWGLARSQYSCDVALNTGASYVTSGDQYIGFSWDTTSASWQQANWVNARLLLTLTLTDGTKIEPGQLSIEFADQQTGAVPWSPDNFDGALNPIEQNGQMVWNLNFQCNEPVLPDQGTIAPTGPDSVYPNWLQTVEDAWEGTINGVMQIDSPAPNGTLVGIQGQRSQPSATGYYRTSSTAAPFGVFEGRLVLDGKPVARSFMAGKQLHWSGLDPAHQQRTGLPASGCLQFNANGTLASALQGEVKVRRLQTTVALDAIAHHADLHPTVHQQYLALRQTLTDTTLDFTDLLRMTGMAQDNQGNWYDAVQLAVTNDLSTIMNSFIPADMWNLAFPGQPQPTLTGELAKVANSPVSGVDNPAEWYQSLATAVLTQGLANGSDTNCQYMNEPRAASWLTTQLATSAVYSVHAQQLFQYEWQQRNSETSQFVNDQIVNAATYATQIDSFIQLQISDIQTNVQASPDNPNLVQELITEAQSVGQYAKTNSLYWACRFYLYNTSPAIFKSLAASISLGTGSSDATTLSRVFQTNIAVLTALDPSGYFAQEYTKTLNIFLVTNILPSMYGFNEDAIDPDVIQQYLQNMVQALQNSGNQKMAAVQTQIQAMLASPNVNQQIKTWAKVLSGFVSSIQGTLKLPIVANSFVNWVKSNYPALSDTGEYISGIFVGGFAGLGIFNLIQGFKPWNQLSPDKQAQIIQNAVQLGVQIVTGMVQRGIRIASMFAADGLSTWQRFAAVSRILLTNDAPLLDQGLVNIGNKAARWLADTKGTLGKVIPKGDSMDEMFQQLYTTSNEEEVGLATKMFGNNLDEFLSTRLGPLFILAGMGYSLYNIIQNHDVNDALALDILNIVGGALSVFVAIGSWSILQGSTLLATFVSIAGPLAILAALAGIGLMIYQLFKTPPEDPIQQFLDNYVRPAGFAVGAKASSIDYATVYSVPGQDTPLVGFSLSANSQTLCCNPDGSISLIAAAKPDPSCVWLVQTDGLGMSRIFTVTQPASSQSPIGLYLSQMSDGSVSFQPKAGTSTASSDGTSVVTQTWWSIPQGAANLTSNGQLASLALTLQPILPDANGNYAPSQASGWLTQSGSGVSISSSAGTRFALTMSGMAPNFLSMKDLNFILNTTPSALQSFGPSFGLLPSTPLTFTLSGDVLPGFLSFDAKTGTFAPNGQQASTASTSNVVLTAANSLGSAMVNFVVTVAAPASATASFMFQPA